MEINRLRCRVNYHPRRGGAGTGDGAGAHRWRLHSGTAAPGLGGGVAVTRGQRRGSGTAPRLDPGAGDGAGAAAGPRGRWQGLGGRGRLDWNKLDRTRFGARAGKKKGRREGSFVMYSLITAGW